MSAWLMIAAGENRQHGGNDGYDDLPSEYYSWDETVANCRKPMIGDTIVLWDKKVLLGISVIQEIQTEQANKLRRRCTSCDRTNLKFRSTTRDYRCSVCGTVSTDGRHEHMVVEKFTSKHSQAWVDLYGLLSGQELRELCKSVNSQHSIRELRLPLLEGRLAASGHDVTVGLLTKSSKVIRGGHALRFVRVRKGQRAFRNQLLADFGAVCAVTGDCPAEVLEAAHLYSYASSGKHEASGGLLLRRDIHRLFDLGWLQVHSTGLIQLKHTIRSSSQYAWLHGKRLQVQVNSKTMKWLALHRDQHNESWRTIGTNP